MPRHRSQVFIWDIRAESCSAVGPWDGVEKKQILTQKLVLLFYSPSKISYYFPRELVPSRIAPPVNCISAAGTEQKRPNPMGSKGALGDISLVKMLMALLLRQLKFHKQIVKIISTLGCLFIMILTFSFNALFRNLLSLLLLTTARSAEFFLQISWAFSIETCSLLI